MTRAWRWLPVALVLVGIGTALVLSLSPAGWLGRPGNENPAIVFSAARLIPSGDQLVLDAQADIALPDAVRLGLDSGVPLYFVVELILAEPRSPWPDRAVTTKRWQYRLNYYELTRHYRINAITGGGSRNYRSLSQALSGLGDVQAAFDTPERLGEVAIVNMRLDSTRLPLPLRPVFGGLWRSHWALKGQAYRWSFDIDQSESRV